MQFVLCPNEIAIVGVLPIVPALSSVFAMIVGGIYALIIGLVTFRFGTAKRLLYAAWRQKWGILIWLGLALSATKGLEYLRARPDLSVTAVAQDSGTWPMFRGNVARTGHADGIPGPIQGDIQWSAARGYEFHASPAIVGDRVIALGSQGDSARFFCWDASDGRQIWSLAPTGYRATFSSPVIDAGRLICGEGLHQTTDARLWSFDLLAEQAPRLRGHVRSSSHIECTPVIVQGRIYFGAGDDGVYCVEESPESPSGLRTVWHVSGDKCPDAETAITVHQGKVYVGLGFGGEALCVLNADTGEELARVPLPFPVFSPPAISGDRLYVGCGKVDYVHYREASPGEVRCIDLKSMKTLWTLPTPAAVLVSVAADERQIIFSTVDGQVFVVDHSGKVKYQWHAHETILAAPAVTERMIYCVGCDGLLTGLNRQLERIWSVRLGAPGEYISSPVVFQGHVYVGTPHDGFLCLGERAAHSEDELKWKSSDHFKHSGQVALPIPREVERVWSYTGPLANQYADVTARPLITEHDLFVPMAGRGWMGLVCAELHESKSPQTRWTFDTTEPIKVAPRLTREHVICLCGLPGESGQLVGVDRDSGKIGWVRDLAMRPAWLASDDDSLYLNLQTESQNLTRLNLRGERIWQTSLGTLDYSIQIAGDIIIAAGSNPNQLTALDRATGRILWQVPLADTPRASPAVVQAQVFVPLGTSIEVRSLVDGALLQIRADWDAASPLYADREHMISTSLRAELLIGATGSPAQPRRVLRVNSRVPPLIGMDSIVFSDTEGKLQRIALDDSSAPQQWYFLEHKTPSTIPAVIFREQVYLSMTGAGLMCLKARSEP